MDESTDNNIEKTFALTPQSSRKASFLCIRELYPKNAQLHSFGPVAVNVTDALAYVSMGVGRVHFVTTHPLEKKIARENGVWRV